MRLQRDVVMGAGQCAVLATVLLAAVYAPRSGEPTALIPLAAQPLTEALAYAEAEHAPVMTIDGSAGTLVILAPDTPGLLRALTSGFVPVAATRAGCAER